MEIEGKLIIEHLKDNQVVEEFTLTNPVSDVGINTIIDIGPENPFVMKLDQAIPMFKMEPTRTLALHNGDKEAHIDFGGDEITYSGDLPIDEAAKLVFEAVFQQLNPRCKTCRWYNNDEEAWRMCNCPKMIYGYGRKKDLHSDDLAVEDDEGWGMVPGPDFGCVHHTRRSHD